MALRIRVDKSALAAKIKAARRKVRDLRTPLNEIADDYWMTQANIFSLRDAGPYPDLKPGYKLIKQSAVGFVYPILKRTGQMAEAFNRGGEGNITKITPQTITLGIDRKKVPYWEYHQLGTSKMPRRQSLFIGDENAQVRGFSFVRGRTDRWIRILDKYVKKELRRI